MRIDQLDPETWIPALRRAADLCTRTTGAPGGALCIGVAGTVQATLSHHGVRCRISAGAAVYRAGPDEVLDSVAFSGPRNRASVEMQLFHAWVEARASNGAKWLVDFTPKYWQASEDRMDEVTLPGVTLRPIDWAAPPPPQFFGPWSEIVYRLKGGEFTPPLGRLSLFPCQRTTAWVERCLAAIPDMAVADTRNLSDDRVRELLRQAAARGVTEIHIVAPDEVTGELKPCATIRRGSGS
jgi:hypothetical protein